MSDCITCEFGEFVWTKHKSPRINAAFPGKCTFPVDTIAVPASVHGGTLRLYKTSIHPGWGEGCPTYVEAGPEENQE